jgi:hypothetical protein
MIELETQSWDGNQWEQYTIAEGVGYSLAKAYGHSGAVVSNDRPPSNQFPLLLDSETNGVRRGGVAGSVANFDLLITVEPGVRVTMEWPEIFFHMTPNDPHSSGPAPEGIARGFAAVYDPTLDADVFGSVDEPFAESVAIVRHPGDPGIREFRSLSHVFDNSASSTPENHRLRFEVGSLVNSAVVIPESSCAFALGTVASLLAVMRVAGRCGGRRLV